MSNLTDCKSVNPTIITCKPTSYEKVGYENVFPKLFEKTAFCRTGFFLKSFKFFSYPTNI